MFVEKNIVELKAPLALFKEVETAMYEEWVQNSNEHCIGYLNSKIKMFI